MRKRKKPILLITLLVCSLGAIAAMNYRPSSSQQAPPEPEVGKEVDTKSKDQIAADVKSKLKGATTPAAPRKPAPPMMDAPPEQSGPIGLKTKTAPYKPVYNDSATSTQWYTDETPKDTPVMSKDLPKNKKVRPPQ